MARVIIIGLDCAEPRLVFDLLKSDLPVISRIMEKGSWGALKSCDPPLTIPAWTCMVTGVNPGQLGCYGIRNRLDYSYRSMSFLNSQAVSASRIWDYATRSGLTSIVVGVPQTYPVWQIKGVMVSGILTPDTRSDFVFPGILKQKIQDVSGGYEIDIEDYRKVSRDELIGKIRAMTRKRFAVFRYLLENNPWDFAMMVEIGLDRLHHCYWQYFDPGHPLYRPGNGFESVIPEYYKMLDAEIGSVMAVLPSDTVLMIVSDHGAQPMLGGFRINQWLIREGYLRLLSQPLQPTPLEPEMVDWNHTMAWGEGGYMGRIFLNVKGREPFGTIERSRCRKIRDEIRLKLENLKKPQGGLMGNRVLYPDEIFPVLNGYPPDMMVYYGNLSWRSLSEIGTESLFTLHNDQGPDGANHAENGIFISNMPAESKGPLKDLTLFDITPTALHLLRIQVLKTFQGNIIPLKSPGRDANLMGNF